MASAPFTANKDYYQSPFILTDRKLSRVVEVARERFERIKGENEYSERYEITFQDNKGLNVNSLENVLNLDNSQKNPIKDIKITFGIGPVNSEDYKHYVLIHFDGNENRSSYICGITLDGISEDLSWLQETMGALEEQIERTIPTDFAYKLKKSLFNNLLVIAAILTAFLSIAVTISEPKISPWNLRENQIDELVSLSNKAKSESEKLDFVFRYLSATIQKDSSMMTIKRISKDYRTYLIGVPILIGLLSAIASILFFYPKYVFYWGDCGEGYERIIGLRKLLWYGVFLALIVGVLGNLFVIGITS